MTRYRFIYMLLSGAILLPACKTQQKPVTAISIPKEYAASSAQKAIDSVAHEAIVPIENFKTFFTDTILVQLLDTAMTSSLNIKIALQKVLQARSGVQFTRGIRMPDLSLNLWAGERKFGDYTIDGVGNYDTRFSPNLNSKQKLPNPVPDFYAGVYSTWEIDIWNRLNNKKKAAIARYMAGEQGKNLVITHLIADVSMSYYNLMILDQKYLMIEKSIALQENALEIIKAQKETGRSNELAIELVSAQVMHTKTLLYEVKQSIITEENNINFLLGRYPQPVRRSSFEGQSEISKLPAEGIPSDMLANRPDIKSAEYTLMAQNADVKAAKRAFYPKLTLNANLGYQAFSAALLFEPASVAYYIAGGIVAPLLNRRVLKAELMQSKASQRAAYLEYEKTILESFTEVYGLMKQLENFQTMQVLKNEQVNVLQSSVSTSKALFSSRRATYLEIITAQENYLKSQMELLDIYYRKNVISLSIYRALGGGWR